MTLVEPLSALASGAVSRGDVKLAFAYLLSLPDAADPGAVLDEYPETPLSLPLVQLLHSMRACSHDPAWRKEGLTAKAPSRMYTSAVGVVVSAALELARRNDGASGKGASDAQQAALDECKRVEARVTGLKSVAQLTELNAGVDAARFLDDETYRRESLLGLAAVPEWHSVAKQLCVQVSGAGERYRG